MYLSHVNEKNYKYILKCKFLHMLVNIIVGSFHVCSPRQTLEVSDFGLLTWAVILSTGILAKGKVTRPMVCRGLVMLKAGFWLHAPFPIQAVKCSRMRIQIKACENCEYVHVRTASRIWPATYHICSPNLQSGLGIFGTSNWTIFAKNKITEQDWVCFL